MTNWYFSTSDHERNGPISSEQLKQVAATGKLRPTDLVWREGLPQWVEARSVKDLFSPTSSSAPPPLPARSAATSDTKEKAPTNPSATATRPAVEPGSTLRQSPALWYYAVNGHKAGPVGTEELQKLADDGFITVDTMLWRQGLPYWIPAISVTELNLSSVAFSGRHDGSNAETKSGAHMLIRVCSGISILYSIGGFYSVLQTLFNPEAPGPDPGMTRGEILTFIFFVFILSAIVMFIAVALWNFRKWAWIACVALSVVLLVQSLSAHETLGALISIALLVILALGRRACGIGALQAS